MFVLGTRPEVIKLAPVILRFRESPDFSIHVCSTGQHREMLAQAFDAFGLSPDRELGLMGENQTLAGLSARVLDALDDLYRATTPSLVIVQGDTTTAMVGALGSYYRRIPVAHVEAGLRTDNKYSPFPEEINRRLIGSIADLHFAPTTAARDNLLREGVAGASVHVTGNTAIDALLLTVRRQRNTALALRSLSGALIPEHELAAKRLVLVTAHRRENHDKGLASICAAVARIAQLPGALVVFSLHYNPNVRATVLPLLERCDNVHLTEPLDYVSFCRAMERSYLILTDSGGIQEEAPSLGRPVLVMRDTTERPEGIAAGNARLVGTSTEEIVRQATALWSDAALYDRMRQARNPYGDGHAAERIHAVVANRLSPAPASAG
ncbi:MAG: UDP-N-acetylglucosamine 2-epimerase (non-hydrolyzing) [Gemmatimonadaceae bacterium]|nr:UDP-N-acetylglucosamine 2-epimerase (non-hydrolyzing) [Gemmatimonadaceae bacterium]